MSLRRWRLSSVPLSCYSCNTRCNICSPHGKSRALAKSALEFHERKWSGSCGFSGCGSLSNSGVSRTWNSVSHWCGLCLEPVNDWDNHRGKRDHICLEMVYNTLIHTHRQWDAVSLWRETASNIFGLKRARDESPDFPYNTCTVGEDSASTSRLLYPFHAFFHSFDQNEPIQRRRELLACLIYLQQKGVLHIDSSNLQQASFYGGVVMFKELFVPLAQMFPLADAKEVSALTQMVSASYNNETVFDLCTLENLLPESLLREKIVVAPPLGADGEDEADMISSDVTSEEPGAVPYYLKGTFFRAVLGALRWSLEPDIISPPPGLGINEEEFGVFCVLAAYAAHLLLAELIFYKISEYVVRVEGVFRREEGLKEAALYQEEQKKVLNSLGSDEKIASLGGFPYFHRIIPPSSCWGMCQYHGGEKCVLSVGGVDSPGQYTRIGSNPNPKRG